MNYTITIQQNHYDQLKSHLIREDEKERAAFIVCGRSLVEGKEDRFLSREVFLLDDDMLLASEYDRVSWDNRYFIDLLKKYEEKNFAVVVIHNHHESINYFSTVDDEGEYNLFKLAFNRNGGDRPYASLIMLSNGSIIGRVWKSDLTHSSVSLIRVIGSRYTIFYDSKHENYDSAEAFNRQQLAFGSSLIQDLSKLHVVIVGCGATGSATIDLLTHLGIRELSIIDKDRVEVSNISRLHGATMNDIGNYKVDVLKKYFEGIGLGTEISAVKEWVSHPSAIEKLKTADFIFNCTDDHAGRILLNRLAYFFLIPVLDMGLVISVKNDPPEIQDLQGRISYLFPGGDCLLTKKIVNPEIAYAENMKREHPEKYEKLKEEAYVIGEGNPSPAVITFTTLVASIAVNDFLNRLVNYNPAALAFHKLFLFHRDVQLTPTNGTDPDCRICGKQTYWARGDMDPFLDIVL
jgi:molybdopterin/thiamine biosynthesis adenylyltransferase